MVSLIGPDPAGAGKEPRDGLEWVKVVVHECDTVEPGGSLSTMYVARVTGAQNQSLELQFLNSLWFLPYSPYTTCIIGNESH